MRKIEEVILKDGRSLKCVLELHKKWLEDEKGGKRADLSDEDLSNVDLNAWYWALYTSFVFGIFLLTILAPFFMFSKLPLVSYDWGPGTLIFFLFVDLSLKSSILFTWRMFLPYNTSKYLFFASSIFDSVYGSFASVNVFSLV